MTDTVHSFRSPIYTTAAKKRLPPSFYAALGIAALIHAGVAWYLIQQTFTVPPAEPLPPEEILKIDRYIPDTPPPPKQPQQPPKETVKIHNPILEAPPTVERLPVPPSTTDSSPTTSAPPVIGPVDGGVTSSSASSPAFVKARWTRFPDGDALASYYPPRAAEDEVEGAATVQCTVMDAKGRVTCVTVSETPKGYGFGKQTEKMVESIGRVDTSQGNVQVGSQLLTTVKWTLQ